MAARQQATRMMERARSAFRGDPDGFARTLEEIPVPAYATDAAGRITHFNRACIEFAGREPQPGRDRWCVTWKLYTETGDPLPHDHCPLALAIERKEPVLGMVAIAERPDGSRVYFEPYPAPILDEHGETLGAVNLLVDVTDRRQASYLREQSVRCRRLAAAIIDERTATTLKGMADEYEERARALLPGS